MVTADKDVPGGLLARVATQAPAIMAAGALASAGTLAATLASHPTPSSVLEVFFVWATLGWWACLMGGAATLLSALAGRTGHSSSISLLSVKWVSLAAAGTVPCAMALAPLFQPLIPRGLDYRPEIARMAAAYAGALVSALLTAAAARRAKAGMTSALVGLAGGAAIARLLSRRHAIEVLGSRGDLYELGFLVLLAAGLWPVAQRMAPRYARALALLLVLTFAGLFSAGHFTTERAAFLVDYPNVGRLMVRAAMQFDFDGDGLPAVLGGTDCDDFDARVGPHTIEIVGNGVDDNCAGGELAKYSPPPQPRRDRAAQSRNVIVVTIDCARADLLAPRTMPRLYAASEGFAVFERAYAPSTHTTGSLVAILQGQLSLGTMHGFDLDVGMEAPLPRLLHSAGYRTLFAPQGWFIAANNWRATEWFDELDGSLATASGRAITSTETTRKAIAHVQRLTQARTPFLAWFHYMDMHEEYMPREGTPFSGDDSPRGRYLQEAWAVDRDLGDLLTFLDASGYFENGGILALHGDHGELLEPARTGHGLWLDEEILRVPLLLKGEGIQQGRYRTRVNVTDLYSTLLWQAASIRAFSAGQDLARVWSGRDQRDADIFVSSFYGNSSTSAVIMGHHKLVQDRRLAAEYLYDLDADPSTDTNLIERQPERAAQLRARLGHVLDVSLNDQVLARRRRLGLFTPSQSD